MTSEQTCLACNKELPANFEDLETCPACGSDLWDDETEADSGELGDLSPKVIGVSVGAAILGAVIWAGIAVATGREMGWIAWGIGGLVGGGTLWAGGAGMRPAVLAAALTALSIAGGRMGATQYLVDGAIDDIIASEEFTGELLDLKSDALDYSLIKGEVTDDKLTQFLVGHNYLALDGTQDFDKESLDVARSEWIPTLGMLRIPGGEEQYIAESRMGIKDNISLWEVIKENLGIVDIVFLMLGIGTAFKMVMGR
jgi:hypothetical protein